MRAAESVDRPATTVPVVVDLDGTLVATDTLVEGIVRLVKRHPCDAAQLLRWVLGNRAVLKERVAQKANLDVAVLPYRAEVLEYIRVARANGRPVVLATAADARVAREVADFLGFFDEVLASTDGLNLSGEAKRARLVREFGERGFEYVGNAPADLRVWRSARAAVLVGPSERLRRRVSAVTELDRVLAPGPTNPRDYLRALRLHHWSKNLLTFVPLLAAHEIVAPAPLGQATIAFFAFSLCASAVYLLNDLLDLDSDRHHPRKRQRPIAAGRLPLRVIAAGVPLLLTLSLALGLVLARGFVAIVAAYLLLNLGYSLYLKAVPILDVLVLAGFYTLRIIAGSVATGVWLSPWLLAFAMFLFLSLAMAKRYAELMAMRTVEGARARARGYELGDAELLAALGGGAGYLAVLVLALYVDSPISASLYARPQLLWALCVLLFYWISHVWLAAHRGRMDDDPLVFALHDQTSRVLLVMMGAVVLAAS